MAQDIIIGSGPAGVAAATALIASGRNVLMLDVGEKMEAENGALKARLASTEPASWDPSDIEALRGPRHSGQTDVMRPYGSDFLFRDSVGFYGQQDPPPWLGLKPSFASGGLSNGWGASVLPYRIEDLAAWPIGADELTPHYSAVADFMPIAAKPDALAALFPMHEVTSDRLLPVSTQASALLARLVKQRNRLAHAGIHFGNARQAVSNDCRTCAMCLYGCPYGLIFNSSAEVDKLRASGNLAYQPGRYVTRFEEGDTGVRLWARDTETGQTVEETGERLFVAAGVLPTARLILASLDHYDKPVKLNDSSHFLLPMLHAWRPDKDPTDEPRHTLTKAYLEIIDPAVNKNTVHVQLYTYSELFAVDMRHRFGRFAGLMKPAIDFTSRRLIVAQAFLHSDTSPEIDLRLVGSQEEGELAFELIKNEATDRALSRVKRKLGQALRPAGVFPLSPLSRMGSPGSSFHVGGSFPMRRDPTGMESDILGRPAGLRRVHIVDASVFPSIPATTITFSVMANAHRIAATAEVPR